MKAHIVEVLRTEFRLREIVTMAFHSQAVCADKANLELVCHVAPDVPDAVVGDPVRLRQVLASLLSNAIKFTKHGGVFLEVEKDSQAADRVTLHFSVRDTGIGIPPEKQQTIFQPFTQVDASSRREFGGTGLGLAITSRLVELMGGKIWLESEVGRGSTFHFTAVLGLNCATNLKA
jgi:signal transduction histidine kinase